MQRNLVVPLVPYEQGMANILATGRRQAAGHSTHLAQPLYRSNKRRLQRASRSRLRPPNRTLRLKPQRGMHVDARLHRERER
jgi:hypothetical protein